MKTNQSIGVFISSTFCDMQTERNYLALFIMPTMKRKLLKRGINFTWRDLRWGVTEEEALHGEVIPRCFSAIDNCSPYFIGIIGNEYGTALTMNEIDNIPLSHDETEIIKSYFTNTQDSLSLTEIEIIHGVFNRKDSKALFFIKSNITTGDSRLLRLIDRVKDSGHPYWEYENPTQLGFLVNRELSDLIIDPNERYDDMVISEFKTQEAILTSYIEDFHDGSDYCLLEHRYNQLLTADSSPERIESIYENIAIIGDWGIGKSSYIAHWINRIQSDGQSNIVYYFINSISTFNTPTEIAKYFVKILLWQDDYKIFDYPEDCFNDPIFFLNQLITDTKLTAKPLVIVVDGIENMRDTTESAQNAKSLNWITPFHPRVMVIISGNKDDYSIKHFLRNSIKTSNCINYKGIAPATIKATAIKYLSQFDKHIEDPRFANIVDSPFLNNPLLLKRFIDILISCSNHDNLNKIIDLLVNVRSFTQLVSLYINCLSPFYDEGNDNLLSKVLYYIALSRNGLSEMELMHLAHIQDAGVIRSLALLLDDFLYTDSKALNSGSFISSDLISFRNEQIRQSVLSINVNYQNDEIEHGRCAIVNMIFKDIVIQSMCDRVHLLSELLYQFYELKDAKSLYACLLNNPDILLKVRNTKDYVRYWRYLYDNGGSMKSYLGIEQLSSIISNRLGYIRKVLWLVRFLGNVQDIRFIIKNAIRILNEQKYLVKDGKGNLIMKDNTLIDLLTDIIDIGIEYSCQRDPDFLDLLYWELDSFRYKEDGCVITYNAFLYAILNFEAGAYGEDSGSQSGLIDSMCNMYTLIHLDSSMSCEARYYLLMRLNTCIYKVSSRCKVAFYKFKGWSVLQASQKDLSIAEGLLMHYSASHKLTFGKLYVQMGVVISQNNPPMNSLYFFEKAERTFLEIQESINVNNELISCYLMMLKYCSNEIDKILIIRKIKACVFYQDNVLRWDYNADRFPNLIETLC